MPPRLPQIIQRTAYNAYSAARRSPSREARPPWRALPGMVFRRTRRLLEGFTLSGEKRVSTGRSENGNPHVGRFRFGLALLEEG
ncbi:hypothetical protein MRB53_036984 [Persea americana]|nr:hypothetical protein MRB53_036984 [Persea americana]